MHKSVFNSYCTLGMPQQNFSHSMSWRNADMIIICHNKYCVYSFITLILPTVSIVIIDIKCFSLNTAININNVYVMQ